MAKQEPLTQFHKRRSNALERDARNRTTTEYSHPSDRRGINRGAMGYLKPKLADGPIQHQQRTNEQHNMYQKMSKNNQGYPYLKPSYDKNNGRGNDTRLDSSIPPHQKKETPPALGKLINLMKSKPNDAHFDTPMTMDRRASFYQKRDEYHDGHKNDDRQRLSSWNKRLYQPQQQPQPQELIKLLKSKPSDAHSDLPMTMDRRASFYQKRDEYHDSHKYDDRQRQSSWNKLLFQPQQRQQQQRPRPVELSAADFLSGSDMRKKHLFEEINTEIIRQPAEVIKPSIVTLPSVSLTISEASALFRVKVSDIKSKLLAMGVIAEENRRDDEDEGSDSTSTSSHPQEETLLNVDTMELLGMEFDIETIRSDEQVVLDSQQLLMQQRKVDTGAVNVARYPPRPPVVTIMGHVDHGKTTLMDAVRQRSLQQSNRKNDLKRNNSLTKGKHQSQSQQVAGTEAGGITQIISAFEVTLQGQGNKITFLDTPGHAAFTAMRHSGTHAADVIVLVVAADDGVSEQTIEIIDLYKSIVKGSSENGISMVVALNKIDKPGINVEEAKRRIENQLLQHGIIAEGMSTTGSEYGQPVQVIPTSGLTGEGLDDLMEGLLLQSEIMELRADDSANAQGIVMDARVEKGLGVVVDCIVRWGNIKKGDVILSGNQMSHVRMLKDVNDKILKRGLPSQPVRIVGFKSLPKAGDPFMVVESEEVGEELLEQRRLVGNSENDRPDGQKSDIELHIHGKRREDSWKVKNFQEMAGLEEADGSTRIPIIVKADADGSLSAIRESLINLGRNSKHVVIVDPISEGIGDINLGDIQLAKESDATIFAFGLKRIDPTILNLAESEGVQICSSDIIYSLLDTAKDTLGSYLPSTRKEHIHGRAIVQAVFSIDTDNGKEKIAGLMVTDGHIYKVKAPLPVDVENSASWELGCHFRILRKGEKISPEGETVTASSLRRFKKSVDNVRSGEDCGLGLSGFEGFEKGDEIVCYSIETKREKL
jgi:small GTP-binding protein